MPRSEKAKELEAAQKAARAAAKQKRKNSTNPEDWGRLRQLREVWRVTAENDRHLKWIALAAIAGPVVLALICLTVWEILGTPGWLNWVLSLIVAVMLGLTIVLYVLPSRAKKAAITRYEDQIGSAEVALQMLPKGWTYRAAVAFTRHQDVVHRAIGPGGVLLIGEGEPGRVKQLLLQEAKRHEKALFNTKVQTMQVGKKEGQIPLGELTKVIGKLPKHLQPSQIDEAVRRLKALDAVAARLPIPKGPMPTSAKGMRSAMRGR